MPLQPTTVRSFGGLDLSSDAEDVGWSGAIDLLNVDLSTPGVIKTRPGYATYNSGTPSTDRYIASFSAGRGRLVSFRKGATTTLDLQSDGGSGLSSLATTSIASTAGDTAPLKAVRYGTPSGEWIFVLDPTGTSTPYRVTMSGAIAWTHPAFAGSAAPDQYATAIGATPLSNRLVIGGGNGDSTIVKFSDPGDPLTFNDYVTVSPNREFITTIGTWQNSTVVFTNHAIYDFYGESTDSDGNAIYNYRRIETPNAGALPGCTCTGPDGLYFASRKGVFRWNGGVPVRVSGPVDPIIGFTEAVASPPFYTGSLLAPLGIHYFNGHIVVTGTPFTTDGATTTAGVGGMWALLNLATGNWTAWQLPHGGDTIAFDVDNSASEADTAIWFANLSGDNGFSRMRWRGVLTLATTDNGTAITSRHRSGFSDLGTPDVKRIHSWRLQGSGSPTLKLSTDFGALEAGGAVTLGTAPAIAEGVRRYAPRGRQVSWQVEGTSPWSLNSLIAYVAGKRDPEGHTT